MRIGLISAAIALTWAGAVMAQDPAPAAAAAAPAEHAAAPAAVQPGDAVAGAAKAAACGACHGMDGNATDPQYPKMAGQHERYIVRHLELFKSGERENPIMLGLASPLGAQDMRDIGAYFASQKALPGLADDSVIAGTEERYTDRGRRLYFGGDVAAGQPACMSCHGPTGNGNPGPAYPSLAGQHARYTKDVLKRFRDGAVYGKDERANAVMSQVAAKLSDTDIDALATFLEGLHRAPPPARVSATGAPAAGH